MNQYQARSELLKAWMTSWPGLSTSAPYVFDDDAIDEATTYARVHVDFDDTTQQTMGAPGNRKFTCPGLVIVELFAPPNAGSKRLDELVGYVKTIFDSKRIGTGVDGEGVRTFASDRGPQSSNGQHVTCSIGVAFEYFELR